MTNVAGPLHDPYIKKQGLIDGFRSIYMKKICFLSKFYLKLLFLL